MPRTQKSGQAPPAVNRSSVQTAKADYGYQVEAGNGFTRFIVTPPPMGIGTRAGLSFVRIMLMVVTAVAVSLLAELVIGKGGLLVLAGTAFLLWRATASSQRAVKKTLQTTRITVSSAGIEKDSILYARADILEVKVQEPRGQNQTTTSTTTVVIGPSAIGAVAASAQAWGTQVGGAVGDAFAAHINQRAFGVSMRYGAQEVALVALVTEGTARALAAQLLGALQTHQ